MSAFKGYSDALGMAAILMLLVLGAIGFSVFSSDHLSGMFPGSTATTAYCIFLHDGRTVSGYSPENCCRLASRSEICHAENVSGTGHPGDVLCCGDVCLDSHAYLQETGRSVHDFCQSVEYGLPV